ncbi:MAG: AAA family ATPase [Nitrososphaeria archaeon]
MLIVLEGCPATGKSEVGRALASLLSMPHIDYAQYLLEKGAADVEGDEIVINEREARDLLKDITSGIVSGIYSLEYLDPEKVYMAYVLRCNPRILLYRYLLRGYSLSKIRDNLGAEYLDLCLKMAIERVSIDKVSQLDVSYTTPQYAALRIYDSITRGRRIFDRVDWLSQIRSPFELIFIR